MVVKKKLNAEPELERILVVTGHICPKKTEKFERTIKSGLLGDDGKTIIKHLHCYQRNHTRDEFVSKLNGNPHKIILVGCTNNLMSRIIDHFKGQKIPPVMVVVDEKLTSNTFRLPVVSKMTETTAFHGSKVPARI